MRMQLEDQYIRFFLLVNCRIPSASYQSVLRTLVGVHCSKLVTLGEARPFDSNGAIGSMPIGEE